MSKYRGKPSTDPLEMAILEDKRLTAEWYLKMSSGTWTDSKEKRWYAAMFESISEQIRSLYQVRART